MLLPSSMKIIYLIGAAVLVFISGILLLSSTTTVRTGHIGVVTLFGKVQEETLEPGLHFINPFKDIYEYNCQNKEVTQEKLGVPSQDQLTTAFDLTVKFRINEKTVGKTFAETGNLEQVIETHLLPQIRSTFREAGNSVENAEEFYLDSIKQQMQNKTLAVLQKKLETKGLVIQDVLIRRVELPKSIQRGVEEKMVQKQKAEREEEELKRYKKEQEKKIAAATSEAEAAKQELLRRKLQAEAKALEITLAAKAKATAIEIEGQALRSNPEVKTLRAIERWDGKLPQTLLGKDSANLLLQLNQSN